MRFCINKRRWVIVGIVALLFFTEACLIFRRVAVTEVDQTRVVQVVSSPVKAHLSDGSTITFPMGVSLRGDTVFGSGQRYDLTLSTRGEVTMVPLDSVVAMESFRTQYRGVETVVVSTIATGLSVVVGSALAVAIFGSCPTIYAMGVDGAILESELFSYSIAPMYEVRDVDRLGVNVDADGVVRLEVRNEALETHYINHVELIEASHEPHENVFPAAFAGPVALRGVRPLGNVTDRAGRDVSRMLVARDELVFGSDDRLLDAVTPRDVRDWLEFEIPRQTGADTVALVLRARNSLLSTVLFYDVMLKSQGLGALDWIGSDLEDIAPAVALGQWAVEELGLRIHVFDDGEWRRVARSPDTGPIAWEETAILVPVPDEPVVRIRLSFPVDAWRIDMLGVADAWRTIPTRSIPVARALVAGVNDTTTVGALQTADERYLQTTPGQYLSLEFDTGRPQSGKRQTFMLAGQGYYIEWMRRDWIRASSQKHAFTPTRASLYDAIVQWREGRAEREAVFYSTRIPVR